MKKVLMFVVILGALASAFILFQNGSPKQENQNLTFEEWNRNLKQIESYIDIDVNKLSKEESIKRLENWYVNVSKPYLNIHYVDVDNLQFTADEKKMYKEKMTTVMNKGYLTLINLYYKNIKSLNTDVSIEEQKILKDKIENIIVKNITLDSLNNEINTMCNTIKNLPPNDCLNCQKKCNNIISEYEKGYYKQKKTLRNLFGENLKIKLWENNIDVIIDGKDNNNITFISADFFDNKNIRESFNTLKSGLRDMQFSKVIFCPYKGSDCSYYENF